MGKALEAASRLTDTPCFDEETNCEAGTYDCGTCILNGNCDRQDAQP